MHTYIHTYTYTCTYLSLSLSLYIYIYIYIYIHIRYLIKPLSPRQFGVGGVAELLQLIDDTVVVVDAKAALPT